MFDAWFSGFLLAVECSAVVNMRLLKLAGGGNDAFSEASLMIQEKVAAAVEAQAALFRGSTTLAVIERFREHVAENNKRLAA